MAALDDRRDRLDIVGALELARNTVRDDPASYLSHYHYISLMKLVGAFPEVRREYAGMADRHASPLFECLAIYTSSPSGYPQAAYDPLTAFERRTSPNACSVMGRAEGGGRTPARLARATQLEEWKAVMEWTPELAVGWHSYAVFLSADARYDSAEAALRKGLTHLRGGVDRVVLYSILADVREEAGDHAAAGALRRAIAAAVERDGRSGVRFHFLMRPGATAQENEERVRERARIARQAPGGWPYEWLSTLTLGTMLSDRGDPAASIEPLDRSVFLADSVKSPLLVLVAYRQHARSLSKMGRLAEAERELLHAISVGEGLDEPYQLAEAYHNLAHVYEGEGRWAEAEAAVTRFVELTRPMDHAQPRMMSLHDAGLIRWKAGWNAPANEAFAEMIRVVDQQERNHYWAGEFLERNGDFRAAIHYYRKGAELDRAERSLNLGGLVRAYRALGLTDSAEVAAGAHDAELTNQLDVPMLPRILAEQGRYAEAVAIARAWAVRRREAGHVQGAALATLELAEILLAARRAGEAATEADLAAGLAWRLNLTEELARAQRLGGLARVRSGEVEGGLALLRLAVARAEARPTAAALLEARLALADGMAFTGSPEALAAYDRAAREVERLTSGLDLGVDRARFRERHLAPFDGAIRLLLDRSAEPETIEALLDWSRRRKTAELALAGHDVPDGFSPRPALPRMAAGEAFVDYLVLDERSAAVIVTQGRARLALLPDHPDSLRVWAQRLRAPLVATYGGRIDLARAEFDLELAHRLYRAALEPLLPELGGVQRLIISPDGPLHLVPFEALPTAPARPGDYAGTSYVIDRWEVAYVPSVEFAGGGAGPAVARGEELLVVAGDAPGADRELAAIRGTWRRGAVLSLTGRAATEEALAARARGRAILHFAVHASADDRDPAASHLRLVDGEASDGWLHAGEIARLPLDARLVVLSGCETVAGPLFAGEGRMGLARAFLTRGAGAVVATDWPVGEATVDVMARFYEGLYAGEASGPALRAARLALRREPATAHPFYWGGFMMLLGG